jgi:hypothetical protein
MPGSRTSTGQSPNLYLTVEVSLPGMTAQELRKKFNDAVLGKTIIKGSRKPFLFEKILADVNPCYNCNKYYLSR